MSAQANVVFLWGAKVHPDVVAELRWFFGSSESEMGLQSNMGSVIKAKQNLPDNGHRKTRAPASGADVPPGSQVIPTKFANPFDVESEFDSLDKMIARLPAAGRHRRVRVSLQRTVYAKLHMVEPGHYAVLAATYEPRQWPNALLQAFGEMAGVAVRTLEANDAYAAAKHRSEGVREWLDDVCRCGSDPALVDSIHRRSSDMIAAAHRAYSRVRT